MCAYDDNPYDTVRFEKSQEPIVYDNIINEPMKTSIEDLESDSYYAKGIDKTPIFNVEKDDFYNNNTNDRQRLQFTDGTKAHKYHAQTRNDPFFIRYSDNYGKQFIRKIK